MNQIKFIGEGFFYFARACAYSKAIQAAGLSLICTSLALADVPAPQAISDLRKSDLKSRYSALQTLQNSHSAQAADAVAQACITEQDINFRLAALDVLPALGFQHVIAPISPMLNDKHVAIRQRTARVIGMLGGAEAEKSLLAALRREKHSDVRAALLQGLSLCASEQSVSDIELTLHDPKPEIRAHAVRALERIPGRQSKLK